MKILIKTGSFCVDGHTKVLRDVLIGLDKKKFDINVEKRKKYLIVE